MRPSTGPRRWSCADLARQAETDALSRDLDLAELVVAERGKAAEHLRDELLGSRGTGSHSDGLVALEQVGLEAALAVDQHCLRPMALGDLDEPLRIRARLGPDHEHQGRALADQLLDRVLPVLGRVADVVRGGSLEIAEA